jgi:ABC-type sugar transport system, periplasmic component
MRSIPGKNIVPLFGVALLAACFAITALKVLRHGRADVDSGRTVIRFAHWQLESGLRDALDALAREYEALHPDVRIEQHLVPRRTYVQWVKTRLIGGTATDLIQLGSEIDDETLTRFFVPVSGLVERPNPYNKGTDLAGVPWRDTFVDGLMGNLSYRPNLLEYYGIPMSMFTVRMYYNRDLWRRLFGDAPPPATYEDFLRVCQRVREEAARSGRALIPIAGSRDNAPIFINRLVSSQTQRLTQSIDLGRILRPSSVDIGLGYLRRDWGAASPAFLDGLAIAREVGLSMQPGYEQLRHDDATFYFSQGRALMITSGSWDLPVFRSMVDFELGVFDVPLPDAAHSRYGRNLLGSPSEAGGGGGMAFGITRQSADVDRAADFLQFLTSRSGNATFSRLGGWLPSVVEVEPPDAVKPFLPRLEGYPPGFDLTLRSLGASSNYLIQAYHSVLVQPTGSVEKFLGEVEPKLESAIREDLGRVQRNLRNNVSRQDVTFTGLLAMRRRMPDDDRRAARISGLTEVQNQQEAQLSWITHELARTAGE